jgi:hypothetical protein
VGNTTKSNQVASFRIGLTRNLVDIIDQVRQNTETRSGHYHRENRFISFKCKRAVYYGLISGVRMFLYSDYFEYSHTSRADLLMT